LRNSTTRIQAKATFVLNALAASVLMAQHAHAITTGAPEAGNFINNTAIAVYNDVDGQLKTLQSNSVSVKVAELYALELTQPVVQHIDAGASVLWVNHLTNRSNTAADFAITNVAPTALSHIRVYVDRNQNGVIDANESELTGAIHLLRDEVVQLIVTADTRADLSLNQQVDLPITATVQQDTAVSTVAVDSLIAVIPELVAIKTVDKDTVDLTTATEQVHLAYQLSVENRALTDARRLPILIDGQPANAVLIRDVLPPNTTYVKALASNPTARIVFATGTTDSYTSTLPTDLDSISELIVAYPDGIASKATESVSLDVAMRSSLGSTTLSNTFNVQYANVTSTVQTRPSNTVTTTVKGKAEKILPKTPDYTQNLDTGTPNLPLYIEAQSTACNIDRDIQNQVVIKVVSPLTNDVIEVLALETTGNSGIYRVKIETENNPIAVVDQILQTLRDDKVQISLTSCVAPNGTPIKPQVGINTSVSFNAPIDERPLSVQKVASTTTAEVGDFVDYTVTVTHTGTVTSTGVSMLDTLPRGFIYVPDTMRVDGLKTADPQGKQGPYLTLGLGDMSGSKTHKVQYRVYVGPNALNGNGINRVRAVDTNNKQSLEASATVKVSAGVLMSNAFVIGKVYTDCNRNGMQDAGEQGVGGVRLYLEDGSFVVTDAEGKYDFYGLSAKTHVLKLDRTTLPSGVELIEQGNRNAGDPASRFVDLKHGELHRADFAMTDGSATCSAPLLHQLAERRKLVEDQNNSLEQVIRADLVTDPNYSLGDVRSMPSSGCISAEGMSANCNVSMTNKPTTQSIQPQLQSIQAPKTLDLEQALQSAGNNSLEILNLNDNQVLPYPQANVQVKAVAGTTIELVVNGIAVSDSRIGKRAVLAERQLAGYDYIGVNLVAGRNTIELRQMDSMGNLRGSKTITVVAPGQMNAMTLKTDNSVFEADGHSIMNVIVSIVDTDGVLVASRTPVTIDSNIGKIQIDDLDPNLAGIQQFVEGGQLLIPVLASSQAGEGRLLVSSGTVEQSLPLRFVPELRPLIASGIVEGALSLRSFDPKSVAAVSRDDGFEQELNELSDREDGKLAATGRAAFFLKGKVKGEYLLTMAYDSDKEKNQRLFRDIRPDEYYPVYGDSAAKGFDAQSTSKLYVRVDKGRSYLLYGDYVTRVEGNDGLALGQYSRTLTGARGHHETDRVNVTGFAARTSSRQIVTETRGKGISGPYPLTNTVTDSITENSEKVEVLVRDRNNPGLIKSRTTLARFSGYEIDSLSNTLYLKNPISSIDADFNPVSLRITVESDDGGEQYNVGGVAGQVRVTETVNVGGSYVQSNDPAEEQKLASANVVARLSDRVKLITEIARSDVGAGVISGTQVNVNADPVGTRAGNAARVELTYAKDGVEAHAYHNQADTTFYNAASPISAGRKESGIRVEARIPQVGLARVEAIRTEDIANQGVRDGLSAQVERALNQYLALQVGARFYQESSNAASSTSETANTPYKGTTLNAKLNATLPWFEGSSAFVEYEQDISESSRKVLALGGSYQLGAQGRLYARHELISSISGLYGLNDSTERNSTLIGIDSNYMKDGTVFSEYRLRDGVSSREAEAALGLRNRWSLGHGVRLNTSFERTESLEGTDTATDATAVSLGLEYLTNPLWKGVAKLEMRWADQSNTLLNTLGAAYKATDDVTLLAKNVYNRTDNKNSGDRVIDRFQIGAAYRPQDNNRFDVLSKLEYRSDDNQTQTIGTTREAVIASLHANYHPARRMTLASQYAAKYVRQRTGNLQSDGVTQLMSGRIIYDINERWDASLNGGVMWSDISSGTHSMLGAEVGYLLTANLWLSGGYNIVTYKDDDLVDADTTVDGPYMRLRFKFDEDLFKVGVPTVNSSVEPRQ
jgi:uncharacterized repeat protein (TIGR01451 family)